MELDQAELLKVISSFLDKHKIPHMLTGALSVVYYGRPRASHDIDFVVELHKKDVKRVISALKELPTEFLLQANAVEEAIEKTSMFNIIYLPLYLKLDFWLLTNKPFDKERFNRKQRVKLLDQYMTITTAEDTIIQKLIWYKEASVEKHLVDAAFVYKIQYDELDMEYLNHWIKTLNIEDLLNELKAVDIDQYI